MRKRAARTRTSRGFSLIEAMISAAVLGIALVGLVQMHTTSIRGTAKAEDVGRAAEIARQLADRVASQPVEQLPPCGGMEQPLGSIRGCRRTDGPGREETSPKSAADPNFRCTYHVSEDALADASSGDLPLVPTGQHGAFRVDTWISSHPNDTDGSTGVLHVWVCWRDPAGMVQEVYTRRVKIRGVW